MRIKLLQASVLAAMPLSLCGCLTGGQHSGQLHSQRERRMTVGVVQREIRKGMSPADVAAALGSPNIVTRDAGGNETWIYDKIATEASYSNDSGGVSGGVAAGGAPGSNALILGGVGANYGKSAGAVATTWAAPAALRLVGELGRYPLNVLNVATLALKMSRRVGSQVVTAEAVNMVGAR